MAENKDVKNALKNSAKSVAYTTKEIVTEHAPYTMSTLENTRSAMRDMRAWVKENNPFRSTGANKEPLLRRMFNSANKIGAEVVEDIKNGDLEFKKFSAAFQETTGLGGDDGDFGSLDFDIDTNFDLFGDTSDVKPDDESDGTVSAMYDVGADVAQTITSAQMMSASSIINAVGLSTKQIARATIKAHKASTDRLLAQQMASTAKLSTQLAGVTAATETINSNLASIVEQGNQMGQFVSQAQTYMEHTEQTLNDIKTLLTEVVAPSRKKDIEINQRTPAFLENGFDIKKYAKYVFNDSSLSMASVPIAIANKILKIKNPSFIDDSLAEMLMMGGPKSILKMGLEQLFPIASKGVRNVDDAIKDAFATFFSRWDNNELKSDLSMMGMLGVGASRYRKRVYAADIYEKDAVAWDGKSAKALREVIPDYLAHIEGYLRTMVEDKDKAIIDARRELENAKREVANAGNDEEKRKEAEEKQKEAEDKLYSAQNKSRRSVMDEMRVFEYQNGEFTTVKKMQDKMRKKYQSIFQSELYDINDQLTKVIKGEEDVSKEISDTINDYLSSYEETADGLIDNLTDILTINNQTEWDRAGNAQFAARLARHLQNARINAIKNTNQYFLELSNGIKDGAIYADDVFNKYEADGTNKLKVETRYMNRAQSKDYKLNSMTAEERRQYEEEQRKKTGGKAIGDKIWGTMDENSGEYSGGLLSGIKNLMSGKGIANKKLTGVTNFLEAAVNMIANGGDIKHLIGKDSDTNTEDGSTDTASPSQDTQTDTNIIDDLMRHAYGTNSIPKAGIFVGNTGERIESIPMKARVDNFIDIADALGREARDVREQLKAMGMNRRGLGFADGTDQLSFDDLNDMTTASDTSKRTPKKVRVKPKKIKTKNQSLTETANERNTSETDHPENESPLDVLRDIRNNSDTIRDNSSINAAEAEINAEENAKNNASKTGNSLLDLLFGEKNSAGFYEGKVLSDVANMGIDIKNFVNHAITGKAYTSSDGTKHEELENSLKNDISKLLDSVLKKTIGDDYRENEHIKKIIDFKDTFMQGIRGSIDQELGIKSNGSPTNASSEDALSNNDGQLSFDDILDTASRAHSSSEELLDSIYGGSNPDEIRDAVNDVQEETNKKTSTLRDKLLSGVKGAAAGLLIGGIAKGAGGFLPGLFAPAGPIGTAVLGTAVGILSRNDDFMDKMFGEKDEDGKRSGGIISKDLQDSFKRITSKILPAGVLGAIGGFIFPSVTKIAGGVVGTSLLGTGPIGGALLAIGASMIYRSNAVQNLLYGDEDRTGTLSDKMKSIGKNGSKFFTEHKLQLKRLGIGIGAGALLGTGLLGNALVPAILGGALGLGSASETFNTWLFGKKNFTTDEEGNTVLVRDKSGWLPRFIEMLNLTLYQPIRQLAESAGENFVDWFKYDIMHNIKSMFEPALTPLKEGISWVSELFKSLGTAIKKVMDKLFNPLIKIGELFTGVFVKFTAGALKANAKLIGSLIASPFKFAGSVGRLFMNKKDENIDLMNSFLSRRYVDEKGEHSGLFSLDTIKDWGKNIVTKATTKGPILDKVTGVMDALNPVHEYNRRKAQYAEARGLKGAYWEHADVLTEGHEDRMQHRLEQKKNRKLLSSAQKWAKKDNYNKDIIMSNSMLKDRRNKIKSIFGSEYQGYKVKDFTQQDIIDIMYDPSGKKFLQRKESQKLTEGMHDNVVSIKDQVLKLVSGLFDGTIAKQFAKANHDPKNQNPEKDKPKKVKVKAKGGASQDAEAGDEAHILDFSGSSGENGKLKYKDMYNDIKMSNNLLGAKMYSEFKKKGIDVSEWDDNMLDILGNADGTVQMPKGLSFSQQIAWNKAYGKASKWARKNDDDTARAWASLDEEAYKRENKWKRAHKRELAAENEEDRKKRSAEWSQRLTGGKIFKDSESEDKLDSSIDRLSEFSEKMSGLDGIFKPIDEDGPKDKNKGLNPIKSLMNKFWGKNDDDDDKDQTVLAQVVDETGEAVFSSNSGFAKIFGAKAQIFKVISNAALVGGAIFLVRNLPEIMGWIKDDVGPWIKDKITWIIDKAVPFFTDTLFPVIDYIGNGLMKLVDYIIKPEETGAADSYNDITGQHLSPHDVQKQQKKAEELGLSHLDTNRLYLATLNGVLDATNKEYDAKITNRDYYVAAYAYYINKALVEGRISPDNITLADVKNAIITDNSALDDVDIYADHISSEVAQAYDWDKSKYEQFSRIEDQKYRESVIHTAIQYAKGVYGNNINPGFSAPGVADNQNTGEGVGYGHFMQSDPRWGNSAYSRTRNGGYTTIANGGCGPTALANVATSLGIKTNPAQTARMAQRYGYTADGGSSAQLFTSGANKLGLKSTPISAGSIKNALSHGQQVIFAGKGDGLYTRAGHILSARGLDKNGNAIVDDPMRRRPISVPLSRIGRGNTHAWSIGRGPDWESDLSIFGDGETINLAEGYIGPLGEFDDKRLYTFTPAKRPGTKSGVANISNANYNDENWKKIKEYIDWRNANVPEKLQGSDLETILYFLDKHPQAIKYEEQVDDEFAERYQRVTIDKANDEDIVIDILGNQMPGKDDIISRLKNIGTAENDNRRNMADAVEFMLDGEKYYVYSQWGSNAANPVDDWTNKTVVYQGCPFNKGGCVITSVASLLASVTGANFRPDYVNSFGEAVNGTQGETPDITANRMLSQLNAGFEVKDLVINNPKDIPADVMTKISTNPFVLRGGSDFGASNRVYLTTPESTSKERYSAHGMLFVPSPNNAPYDPNGNNNGIYYKLDVGRYHERLQEAASSGDMSIYTFTHDELFSPETGIKHVTYLTNYPARGSKFNILPSETNFTGSDGQANGTSTNATGSYDDTSYSSADGSGKSSGPFDSISKALSELGSLALHILGQTFKSKDEGYVSYYDGSRTSGGSYNYNYDFTNSGSPADVPDNRNPEVMEEMINAAGGNITGDEAMFQFFTKGLGYTDATAAGILGCWNVESKNNPKVIEGDYLDGGKMMDEYGVTYDNIVTNRESLNKYTDALFDHYHSKNKYPNRDAYTVNGDSYPGIGYAQWTGPRALRLLAFAKDVAKDNWYTTNTQMQYLDYELRKDFPGLLAALYNLETPGEAASTFFTKFESGGSTSGVIDRINNAKRIYSEYAGMGEGSGIRDSYTSNYPELVETPVAINSDEPVKIESKPINTRLDTMIAYLKIIANAVKQTASNTANTISENIRHNDAEYVGSGLKNDEILKNAGLQIKETVPIYREDVKNVDPLKAIHDRIARSPRTV